MLKDSTQVTLRIRMIDILAKNLKNILEGFYHKKDHFIIIGITMIINCQFNQNKSKGILINYKAKLKQGLKISKILLKLKMKI